MISYRLHHSQHRHQWIQHPLDTKVDGYLVPQRSNGLSVIGYPHRPILHSLLLGLTGIFSSGKGLTLRHYDALALRLYKARLIFGTPFSSVHVCVTEVRGLDLLSLFY